MRPRQFTLVCIVKKHLICPRPAARLVLFTSLFLRKRCCKTHQAPPLLADRLRPRSEDSQLPWAGRWGPCATPVPREPSCPPAWCLCPLKPASPPASRSPSFLFCTAPRPRAQLRPPPLWLPLACSRPAPSSEPPRPSSVSELQRPSAHCVPPPTSQVPQNLRNTLVPCSSLHGIRHVG